jgi:hypothetical protein
VAGERCARDTDQPHPGGQLVGGPGQIEALAPAACAEADQVDQVELEVRGERSDIVAPPAGRARQPVQ